MKVQPTIAAVYNPTTGQYTQFSKPVTMQQANTTAAAMLARNPAAPTTPNRPNFGWSEDELIFNSGRGVETTKEIENTGNLNPTQQYSAGAKTNYSGLYIAVGVIAFIMFLNR